MRCGRLPAGISDGAGCEGWALPLLLLVTVVGVSVLFPGESAKRGVVKVGVLRTSMTASSRLFSSSVGVYSDCIGSQASNMLLSASFPHISWQ